MLSWKHPKEGDVRETVFPLHDLSFNFMAVVELILSESWQKKPLEVRGVGDLTYGC